MPIDFRKPQYFKEFRFGNNLIWNTIKKFLNTFTGEIVRFFSEESEPIVKLEANFTPIQDLHGQDAPYPAGGGKNLLPIDTVVHESDTAEIVLWEGSLTGTYTLSADVTNITNITTDLPNAGMLKYICDGTQTIRVSKNTPYVTITGTITKVSAISAKNYSKWTGTAKFQMEEGSTPSAWQPYSNICPISGHTGAVVNRTGKNLFDPSVFLTASGWTETDGVYSGNCSDIQYSLLGYLLALPNFTQQITLSLKGYVDYEDSRAGYFRIYYADGTTSLLEIKGKLWKDYTLTSTAGKVVAGIGFTMSNPRDILLTDFQVEIGSTATDYEPYSGTSVTITFGSTVYGGKLTVKEDGTGSVVGEYTSNTLVGTENLGNNGIQPYGGIQVVYTPLDVKAYGSPTSSSDLWCDKFKVEQSSNALTVTGRTTTHGIHFNMPSDVTTVALAKTWFSENNTQVVFKLETPVTIALTAQQVNALLGNNTVWVDSATGDITVQAFGTEIV